MSSFGSGAYTMLAFILVLSIIVAIHEYGHYIVGKWCGIHAEVFSLGFGPILGSRVDKHGTRWQIAAVPFGGFVRFLGDTNAAGVGPEGEVSAKDRRRSMAGAPLWARSLTVLAGPVFNFILAMGIFMAVALNDGKPLDPITFESLVDLPEAYQSEFQEGDELISVEGQAFGTETFGMDALPVEPTIDYLVRRDGEEITIKGPYLMPSAIQGINPRSAAADAGLRKGDVITAIDGTPVVAFDQIVTAVLAVDGKPLTLDVWRDGETQQFTLSPRRQDIPLAEGGFETRWLIGINGSVFFDQATESLGVWESFKRGGTQTGMIIEASLSGMYHVATGQISTCNLSGPIAIAQTSGTMAQQGGKTFLWFVGLFSAGVGLMNLFPIPILDGGHLVFHAYEAVFRRKPSDMAYNVLMIFGLGLIGMMMVFTVFNDLLFC